MAIKFAPINQQSTSPELDKALGILLKGTKYEGAPKAPKKRAPAGTFDRTAYQREYMRKRRAKES